MRRADHSSRGVLPCVLIRLWNFSVWGDLGPYKDSRASDDDDDDDEILFIKQYLQT
jgi:hypothetical protein